MRFYTVVSVLRLKNTLELRGQNGRIYYYKLPDNKQASDYKPGQHFTVEHI